MVGFKMDGPLWRPIGRTFALWPYCERVSEFWDKIRDFLSFYSFKFYSGNISVFCFTKIIFCVNQKINCFKLFLPQFCLSRKQIPFQFEKNLSSSNFFVILQTFILCSGIEKERTNFSLQRLASN